jgi:hypothetical protein
LELVVVLEKERERSKRALELLLQKQLPHKMAEQLLQLLY